MVVGDAILAIWRVGRVEELQAELAKVVACCLGIQEECGEWSTDIGVKLTVKIGKMMTNTLFCLFVYFVALRPKSTAMVMAGRSVHLTTLFSWTSLNKQLTSTSCTSACN